MEGSKKTEDEIKELKEEIEEFKREKERVKSIVGKIGGVPAFNNMLSNIIFVSLVVISLVLSLISHGTLRLAMLEVATAIISLKLLYIVHKQSKVNHFQLWVLSSLEWRVNEMVKLLKKNNQGK